MFELAFINAPDIAIIFVVVLVVFGPQRLPEVGRQLGRMVGEMRKMSGEFTQMFHQAGEDLRDAVTFDEPVDSPGSIDPAYHQDSIAAGDAAQPATDAGQNLEQGAHAGLVVSTLPRSEGGA